MVNRSWSWVLRGGLLILTAILANGGTLTTLAQDSGTPVPQATPTTEWYAPSPDECTVEPREFPLFSEGVRQKPPATPLPLPLPATPTSAFIVPDGDPVSTEVETDVLATVIETIACRNANQVLRAYALFTEPMLVSLFGGPATIDPEIRALFNQGEEATPLQRRQRVALLQFSQVVLRPDGRVGAIVTTGTTDRIFQDYLIFTYDAASERWLLDEAVPLATEPAA